MIIADLEAGTAAERHELGEALGATSLGRLLGVSRDTVRRYMAADIADLSWTDSHGRLRVRRSDIERRLAETREGVA